MTYFGFFIQALEGKDVKELMTNVGSAGPAAPAAGGGAAAPAEAAAGGEDKKKEEGIQPRTYLSEMWMWMCANSIYREGGVRRGHGIRSFRLSVSSRFPFLVSSSINVFSFRFVSCLPFLP